MGWNQQFESWERINAATAKRRLCWGFEIAVVGLFVLFWVCA